MIAYSEKFELIQWIKRLNDKSIFDQLKRIKNDSIESAPDWWNEISISERENIERGLADIAKYAHEIDLSVMVFTGYLLEDLTESQFFGSQNLLKYTDLLIDGEFDYTQQETIRNWVGSKNQNFHYLTPRYSEEIEVRRLTVTNEWRISSDGYIISNGLPSKIAN